MGNFCSKCGKKHDAKKYKSQEETEDNKRNVTTATKQTSVPIKNESNNSGSTGVITSDSKQPSNQKPDLSESGSGNKNPNVSSFIDGKPWSINITTFIKKALCLVLQIFLQIEAFESNKTSDGLNHSVQPVRSCFTLKFTKSWR